MNGQNTATRWRQVNLWCDDWQAAEQMAVTHLGPLLTEAEHTESMTCWWFVRKGASWRLRFLPTDSPDETGTTVVEQLTGTLIDHGVIRRWTPAIYEPEIHAFGGADAMDVAHALFHADSRHLLRHLAQARKDHLRELGLLLGTQLMRAAEQDWYEQGDIWATVAAHRITDHHPTDPSPTAVAAAHQLITAAADTADSPLRSAPTWPAAFRHAGQELADLAAGGSLTRGLRAVLTHHVLFAWNRLGISAPQQHLLAAAASKAVFQQETAAAAGRVCDCVVPARLGCVQ
ncbi:MAG: thiopeptide-type bacteriocin biosynthesis protein [Actinomycetota bacterium]|nr:thiopeptide-type bacteriocin biosynthesis protein [Actinomycetota bacterium]